MDAARPAVGADLHDLVRLWELALTELRDQRGGPRLAAGLAHPKLDRFLRESLDDPDRFLVVGVFEQVAVGLASLRCDRATADPVGHLEVVFVEEGARQLGVGRAMLSLVLDRCAKWGTAGVDAPALPGSRAAKSFFESQGMRARLLVMHRPLGGTARD